MYSMAVHANTCCFFGHREIKETKELKQQVYSVIESLILEHHVDTFLFGSKSRFNGLCYEQVTRLKERYPCVNRVYVRAEFLHISKDYETYLLERYEDTYFPDEAVGAGKAVYLERNRAMINRSHFCVVYYKEDYLPTSRKSGTKLALNYAMKKSKEVIVLPK